MAGVAQVEVDGSTLVTIVDAESQSHAKAVGRLVERKRGGCRLGREQVVRDGALGSSDRRRLRVMMRECGEPAPSASGCRFGLERPGNAEMQLGATRRGHPVRDRTAHQLVCESKREAPLGCLLNEAASDGLVDGVEQDALFERRGPAHGVELELGSDDGAELEDVAGRRREPGDTMRDDFADRLRRPDVVDRKRQANRGRTDLERA